MVINILKPARLSCPKIPENVSKKLRRQPGPPYQTKKKKNHKEIHSDSQLQPVPWLMMVCGATKELTFGSLLISTFILDKDQADLNYRS